MTTVNDNEINFDDDAVFNAIMDDPELSQLPLGSDEMKAALAAKADKTNVDATAGDDTEETGEENESEDDESEDEEAKSETKEEYKAKRNARSFQARIDELTRLAALEKQRADELESRLKGKDTQASEQEEVEQSDEDAEPAISDFLDDVSKFYQEHARWHARQVDAARKAEEQKAEQDKHVNTMASKWDAKMDELEQEMYADIKEVVTTDTVQRLNASPQSVNYVFRLDNGPAIVYALAKDGDLSQEFAKADPIEQVAILAELKVSLTGSKKKSTATTTGAPTPPRPLKGTGASPRVYDDSMSDAEFDRVLKLELSASGKKKRF